MIEAKGTKMIKTAANKKDMTNRKRSHSPHTGGPSPAQQIAMSEMIMSIGGI